MANCGVSTNSARTVFATDASQPKILPYFTWFTQRARYSIFTATTPNILTPLKYEVCNFNRETPKNFQQLNFHLPTVTGTC